MYPRHAPRVLGEMRYLLVQGQRPTDLQIDSLTDPPLIAGLADEKSITQMRFARWWTLAETKPSRPWAMNLEERLLLWAARTAKPGALPKGFPNRSSHSTALAGKLRAAALAKSGDLAAAREEIRQVDADAEQARLSAQVELARGRPDLAAETPVLGDDMRNFLLRIRLDDRALERMAKHSGPAAKAARFELAVRLAANGKWSRAASLITKDEPPRAELWREAGALAKGRDAASELAFARFLDQNQEILLYEADHAFYRSLSERYVSLVHTGASRSGGRISKTEGDEPRRIEAALTRGTTRWLALEAYARALQANPRAKDAATTLEEADRTYNRLINWGGGGLFWESYAKNSPPALAIRAAGKTIRSPTGGSKGVP
jgi:hypothetical protein